MGRERKLKIGKQIRALRNAMGWTREEVAERAGVALDTLARYEREERQPGLVNALKLAEVLGVSVEEMAKGKAEPGRQPLERQLAALLAKLDDKQIDQITALIKAMIEGTGR